MAIKIGGVKSCHLAGGAWKAKQIAHKGKASQTPGKKKGESCQTDADKQFYSKRSRSYKYPGYSDWCKRMDRMNGGQK